MDCDRHLAAAVQLEDRIESRLARAIPGCARAIRGATLVDHGADHSRRGPGPVAQHHAGLRHRPARTPGSRRRRTGCRPPATSRRPSRRTARLTTSRSGRARNRATTTSPGRTGRAAAPGQDGVTVAQRRRHGRSLHQDGQQAPRHLDSTVESRQHGVGSIARIIASSRGGPRRLRRRSRCDCPVC